MIDAEVEERQMAVRGREVGGHLHAAPLQGLERLRRQPRPQRVHQQADLHALLGLGRQQVQQVVPQAVVANDVIFHVHVVPGRPHVAEQAVEFVLAPVEQLRAVALAEPGAVAVEHLRQAAVLGYADAGQHGVGVGRLAVPGYRLHAQQVGVLLPPHGRPGALHGVPVQQVDGHAHVRHEHGYYGPHERRPGAVALQMVHGQDARDVHDPHDGAHVRGQADAHDGSPARVPRIRPTWAGAGISGTCAWAADDDLPALAADRERVARYRDREPDGYARPRYA